MKEITLVEYLTYLNANDRETLLERAAIMEYDGKMSRKEAESKAIHDFISVKHRRG